MVATAAKQVYEHPFETLTAWYEQTAYTGNALSSGSSIGVAGLPRLASQGECLQRGNRSIFTGFLG